MSTPFAFDPEARSELVPRDLTPGISADLAVFDRVEGLVGEEQALVTIPVEERKPEHRDRLRAVSEELDRIWEHLHERARRQGIAEDGAGQG